MTQLILSLNKRWPQTTFSNRHLSRLNHQKQTCPNHMVETSKVLCLQCA